MEYAVTGFWGPIRFAALCCAAVASLSAEPVSYSGKVVDAAGAPVSWAFVKLEGTSILVQSGLDGSFTLTGEAASIIYPDPKPPGISVPEATLPIRYLPDGRAAGASHVAAMLLLSRSRGERPATRTFLLTAASFAAGYPDPRPPTPPGTGELENAARVQSAWTLGVSMANYQPGSFPQAVATAKGLSLSLTKSATDTATYAAEKKLCLDTINTLRAQVGKPKVTWSKSLEAFADQGTRYDSERNKAHAHFGAFSTRADPSDAENAVPGWPIKQYKNVAAVVAQGAKMMWDEGPGGGHYENIIGNQTQLGCGIYVTPAGGVWVIHDFK